MNQNKSNLRPLASEPVLETAQFEALRDVLAHYSGIYLDETRRRLLTAGVAQRLARTGLALESYAAYIMHPQGRSELQKLAELVLNHETFFFRNLPHMHALREVILPDLHRRKAAGMPLRIWSAGCSTGEEPYSLAIIALETLGNPLPRSVEIWATDLSEQALTKARAGRYRGRTLNNVPADIRDRYFTQQADVWSVNDNVRAMVRFEQLNLLEPFPPQIHGVDIIFCQNVTIYFQLPTCRDLIERFHTTLGEGGLLFLGFSETLWNIHNGFRLQEIDKSFVYYKEAYYRSSSRTTQSPYPTDAGETRTTTSAFYQARHLRPACRLHPSQSETSTVSASSGTNPQTDWNFDKRASGLEIIRHGHALLDAGLAEEALEMLYQTPLDGPHAPQSLALIARAHANRGDQELALAEARRAVELDSLTTDAYLLLGMLYAQQGQLLLAVQYFERARYLDTDAALISFHLAEVYRQLNQRERALREYSNTLRKLTAYAPDGLLDGVAVRWIRETCQRYVRTLAGEST